MKLIDFIICDDIRTELGNKFSLMGIYEDAINFNVSANESGKWPKVIRIGFFIRIKTENYEVLRINKFKLNINYNDKIKTISEGILRLDINKSPQVIRLVLVIQQFAFENSGFMSASIELIDKTGQVINNFEMSDKIKITENIISIQ